MERQSPVALQTSGSRIKLNDVIIIVVAIGGRFTVVKFIVWFP